MTGGIGPYFRMEAGWAPKPQLEIGPYASLSEHPISSIDGFDYHGSDAILLVSAGGSIKWRLPLSPQTTLRLGGSIGINYANLFLATQSGGERFPGYGLGLGGLAELRQEVAPHIAVLGQLGFIGQPVGSADLPASTGWGNQSFAFFPIVFATVGPGRPAASNVASR